MRHLAAEPLTVPHNHGFLTPVLGRDMAAAKSRPFFMRGRRLRAFLLDKLAALD